MNNFEEIFESLKEKSLFEAMELIKNDLNLLGISHDNFFSESMLIKKDLVNKTVKKLRDKKFVVEGFLEAPKGEVNKNWKKIQKQR